MPPIGMNANNLSTLPLPAASSLGGPLIGAAGTILGGVIGNLFNDSRQEESEQFQREFAQNAIRWRVADAKAAGLHPLFALGANVSSGQPMILGDQLGDSLREASQNIGGALAKQATIDDRVKQAYEIDLLRAQRDETDARAGYWLSETARQSQNQNGLGIQHETNQMGQVPNVPGVGMIDVNPSAVTSHTETNEGISAGKRPAFEVRMLGSGMPIVLPASEGESPEEIISEMSFAAWAGLLQRNARFWGPGWMRDFVNQRYRGLKPEKTYDKRTSLKEF